MADAVGAVGGRGWFSGLAFVAGVHAGHDPDAQRGLLRERRGRPRLRPSRQAHGAAAGDVGPGVGEGGAGGGRSAGARRVRAGAHHQRADHRAVLRRAGDHAGLSVRQARAVDAAGGAGCGLQLRHPHGLCGRAGRGAGAGLGAVAGQPVLGAGLRHRVRHGRPRRRPAHRHEDLGDHARPRRRGGGDGVLPAAPGDLDGGAVAATAADGVAGRAGGGAGPGGVALHVDPHALARGLLRGVSREPLAGVHAVCRGGAQLGLSARRFCRGVSHACGRDGRAGVMLRMSVWLRSRGAAQDVAYLPNSRPNSSARFCAACSAASNEAFIPAASIAVSAA